MKLPKIKIKLKVIKRVIGYYILAAIVSLSLLGVIIFIQYNLLILEAITLGAILLFIATYLYIRRKETPTVIRRVFYFSKGTYYVSAWIFFEELTSILFYEAGISFTNELVGFAIIFLLAIIPTIFIDLRLDSFVISQYKKGERRLKGDKDTRRSPESTLSENKA